MVNKPKLLDQARNMIRTRHYHVIDIDFGYKQITVRNGKGSKDRVTMLPEIVIFDLQKHLERVKMIHERDLQAGFGSVHLPA